MSNLRLKPAKRYLLWRWIVVTAVSVEVGVIPLIIWASIVKNIPVWLGVFAVLFPSILTQVFIFLNVLIFTFNYSLLGKFERSQPPQGFVASFSSASYGRVGRVRVSWPWVQWSVGKEGILVSVQLFGSAFIPVDSITQLTYGSGTCDFVEHTCPEIATPLAVPRDVYQAVQTIVEARRQQAETSDTGLSRGNSSR